MNSIDEWLGRPGGLAEQLHSLRTGAGLTGARMAADLSWTQSKISKLENGRQMPTAGDITAWARSCGATSEIERQLQQQLAEAQSLHREWKQQVRLGQVAIQRNYDDLAKQATRIRNVENLLIPGLLQTPEYARARIAEGVRLHDASANEVDAATAERMRRQRILYDTAKSFEFVITEAALRLLLCPPTAMLAQLDRLLGVIGMSNITLAIIPFGVQLEVAPQNGFIMFDDLAVVESFVSETFHHGNEAASYAAAMDALIAEAWTGDQARELIVRARDAVPR